MESVPLNTHGGLEEQISQLKQCKPLTEHEVRLLLHLIIHYPYFFEFFLVRLVCVLLLEKWRIGFDSLGFDSS